MLEVLPSSCLKLIVTKRAYTKKYWYINIKYIDNQIFLIKLKLFAKNNNSNRYQTFENGGCKQMEELIEKAKEGDKQAFTRVNIRYTKWII